MASPARGHPELSSVPGTDMRLVNVYLSGYFLLIIGALAALWYGGVLSHLPLVLVLAGIVISVGFGVVLFLTAGKPVSRD
jgi:uncharacterized RDD family membrane protein YckC